MLPKLKVLFLCTGNSCRSQMAEAWARHLHGDRIEPYSAGLDPSKIDPRAVRVMEEVEVDLTRQRSKHVEELVDVDFDLVITLCDHARQTCPSFPRAKRSIHCRRSSSRRFHSRATRRSTRRLRKSPSRSART